MIRALPWLFFLACREMVGAADADEVDACLAAAEAREDGASVKRVAPPEGSISLHPLEEGACTVSATPGIAANGAAICDVFSGDAVNNWVPYTLFDTASIEARAIDESDVECLGLDSGLWGCTIQTGPVDESSRLDLVFSDRQCTENAGGPFVYLVDSETGGLVVRASPQH